MDVLSQMSALFGSENPLKGKPNEAKLLSTLHKIATSGARLASFEDFKKITESFGDEGKELFDFVIGKMRTMSPPEIVIGGFEKEQDVIDVLKKLEADGYAWRAGDKPTEWGGWMKEFAKYNKEGGFVLTIPKSISYGANDDEQKMTSNPENQEIDFRKFLNKD